MDEMSNDEVKEQILARRKAIRVFMSEIQYLTQELHKRLGPAAVVQFMADSVERADF